jgi:hypothetical protein
MDPTFCDYITATAGSTNFEQLDEAGTGDDSSPLLLRQLVVKGRSL